MVTADAVPGAQKFRIEFIEVNGTPSTFSEETYAIAEKLYVDVSAWPAGTISGIIKAGGDYQIDSVPQGIYSWGEARPFVLVVPGIIAPGTLALEK